MLQTLSYRRLEPEKLSEVLTMIFEYWRVSNDGEELVAKGEQQIACMQRQGEKLVPTPVPEPLRQALQPYGCVSNK